VASSRPLNSSLSDTVRCTAGATLTGAAGGGPLCASAALPQAVSQAVDKSRTTGRIAKQIARGVRDLAAHGESLSVMFGSSAMKKSNEKIR